MLLGVMKQILIVFKPVTLFKSKMATKTKNFQISHIAANNRNINICETPRYMLQDTINPFMTRLNWSDDVSQNGS